MDELRETATAADAASKAMPLWAPRLIWAITGALYAATLALFGLLGGIVLLEKGEFGPAPRTVTETILWSVTVMILCNLVFPWVATHDPRMSDWRPPIELHALVAICGMVSMLGYLLVIDPAGGRRELLSVAIPAVLLPVGCGLAWRAFQIGAKSVGNPARDVSDWTMIDHLLGRRRSSTRPR